MGNFHVLIIGGGGTGGAVAHDLALRGLQVTLVERGELTSGTTGRHHGFLHSGARYVEHDKESARECIEENRILRRIAPGSFSENDGLFVAITDEDVEYSRAFLQDCAECGIPTREYTAEETLRLEPNLNPDLKLSVQVPDATMDAMRMPLRFFATAKQNGAVIKPYHKVIDVLKQGNTVTGVRVKDHTANKELDIGADIVVSATGPWCGQIATMAGVEVPIQPAPGVMVTFRERFCNMVINRMTHAGDGDIIVPQRELSTVGTSEWYVDDPDNMDVPEDHIQLMYDLGALLIPAIKQAPFRAAWSAARPLIAPSEEEEEGAEHRMVSRTFESFDHASEGAEGLITITGGKATTLRGMAEATADMVCEKLGIDAPCRTREVVLLPHNAYYY